MASVDKGVKIITWHISLLVLFLSLSFLLYGNTIRGQFVGDDSLFTYRRDIRNISSLAHSFFLPYLPNGPESGVWRPIATIATGLQYIATGESPEWFHVTNILLNGLATYLVFVLVYKLFQKETLAVITALLFAFLPIHVEAVAFIKSREDLLASVFFLLSWIMFLRGTLFASSGFYLLSALSKETFIIHPVVCIVVYNLQHKRSLRSNIRTWLYFALAFMVYLLTRYAVLGTYAFGSDNAPFVINPIAYVNIQTRIWTAFRILFTYVNIILFPIKLSANYHFNQIPLVFSPFESRESLTGILIVVLFILISLSKRWKNTPVGIGIVTFIFTYVIVSKFFVTAGEFMAERWMYIPSLGLTLIAGFFIDILIKQHRFMGLVVLCIIIFWDTSIIIPRNRIWFSQKTHYESMVRDAPQSAQAHYLLGSLYFDEKNYVHAQQEADKASSIYQNYAPLLTLQGDLRVINGKYSDAKNYLLKATRLDASYFRAFVDLAAVYYVTGKYTEVVRYYQALVPKSFGRLTPKNFLVYATALTKLRKYQESIKIMSENISNNDMPEVRFLLAVNYYNLGEVKLAKEYLDWDLDLTGEQKLEMIQSF